VSAHSPATLDFRYVSAVERRRVDQVAHVRAVEVMHVAIFGCLRSAMPADECGAIASDTR
jgi:hypothetical protein